MIFYYKYLRKNIVHLVDTVLQDLHYICKVLPEMSLIKCSYLLTPWCRFLLGKLNGLQLVKKFPAFHGTRRFITARTSFRHLCLSWASPIQSTYPHPNSWRSILILSTHLRLGLHSIIKCSAFQNYFISSVLNILSPFNIQQKINETKKIICFLICFIRFGRHTP